MSKYKNKYRTETVRLKSWNYGWQGAYFITVCTKNRVHFFGKIENGKQLLSDIGLIAQEEWFRSVELRPDMNIRLGEFVVMPDHIHGIIFIGENEFNTPPGRDVMHHVSTRDDGDGGTNSKKQTIQNQFGPQRKNLASIMRGYKSAVTINARKIRPDFGWQPRFYEHIIRNEEELNRISEYILRNPQRWTEQ